MSILTTQDKEQPIKTSSEKRKAELMAEITELYQAFLETRNRLETLFAEAWETFGINWYPPLDTDLAMKILEEHKDPFPISHASEPQIPQMAQITQI